MHKTNRIWDVLVLWPLIYCAVVILFIVGMILIMSGLDPDVASNALFALGSLFFLIHVASIVIMIVVYIYAIHRLYIFAKIPVEKKKTWLILVVLFNFIAIPILHFMYLRK